MSPLGDALANYTHPRENILLGIWRLNELVKPKDEEYVYSGTPTLISQ